MLISRFNLARLYILALPAVSAALFTTHRNQSTVCFASHYLAYTFGANPASLPFGGVVALSPLFSIPNPFHPKIDAKESLFVTSVLLGIGITQSIFMQNAYMAQKTSDTSKMTAYDTLHTFALHTLCSAIKAGAPLLASLSCVALGYSSLHTMPILLASSAIGGAISGIIVHLNANNGIDQKSICQDIMSCALNNTLYGVLFNYAMPWYGDMFSWGAKTAIDLVLSAKIEVISPAISSYILCQGAKLLFTQQEEARQEVASASAAKVAHKD